MTKPTTATYAPHIKVATYNINLGGRLDPELDAATMRLRHADIAFLQEIDDRQWLLGGAQNQPRELARRLSMASYWGPAVPFNAGTVWGWRGPAILSRYILFDTETHNLPLTEPNAREGARIAIVTAKAKISGTTYLLISSHFGGSDEDRRRAATFVRNLMLAHEGPAVFGADVNGMDLLVGGTPIFDAYDGFLGRPPDGVGLRPPILLITPGNPVGAERCDVPEWGSGNDQIYVKNAGAITDQSVTHEIRCSTPPVSDHPFVLTRLG